MPPRYETFLRSLQVLPERIPDPNAFPFTIPAIRSLRSLELDPRITFFLGENGSGKSTLIEAIAMAEGFNPGSRRLRGSPPTSAGRRPGRRPMPPAEGPPPQPPWPVP
jgi:hypothetical protein